MKQEKSTPRLKLAITDQCVPDKFRFTHPISGYFISSFDKDAWLGKIKKHCEDNGYPPVDPADAIDQLCHLLPPGWCSYESGEKPAWFVETRLTVWDVLNGTQTLASFMLHGMQLVSKELAESRSDCCAKCFYNVQIAGCSPCIGLYQLIENIGGSIKTQSDSSLLQCAVCKCSTKAKTRMRIEDIEKGTTQEHMERFPSFCWVRNEVLTLREKTATQ